MEHVELLKNRSLNFEEEQENHELKLYNLDVALDKVKIRAEVLETCIQETKDEFAKKEIAHRKLMTAVEGALEDRRDERRDEMSEMSNERQRATYRRKRRAEPAERSGQKRKRRYYVIDNADRIKQAHLLAFKKDKNARLMNNSDISTEVTKKYSNNCAGWHKLMKDTGLGRQLCTVFVSGTVGPIQPETRTICSNP